MLVFSTPLVNQHPSNLLTLLDAEEEGLNVVFTGV